MCVCVCVCVCVVYDENFREKYLKEKVGRGNEITDPTIGKR